MMVSAEKTVEDNPWWKDIFRIFVTPGNDFEIRCWSNEKRKFKLLNNLEKEHVLEYQPKNIHGTLNERFISVLLNEEKPNTQFYTSF